jgi:hypothetical protein
MATTATATSNFLNHDPYDAWKQELKQYQETKTSFKGFAEPYQKRTHKEIKTKETIYNPITQKFNDPSIENQVSQAERNNFIEVIAKNKVLLNV